MAVVDGLLRVEPRRSVQAFKSRDEYLTCMKEDLSEWLNGLYKLDVTEETFFEALDTGTLLCQHANAVQSYAREKLDSSSDVTLWPTCVQNGTHCTTCALHQEPLRYKLNARPRSFHARDNIHTFILWCRSLGVPDVVLFETEDLVLRKNERNVVLCLLEVARRGARYGMPAPCLIQLEAEIDAEIAAGDDVIDAQPFVQRRNFDLMSLEELVREQLNLCTCPDQFPMIRVSEGKYKIGDTQTLIFVRVLRNHVMVRIGGGWDTLENYLNRHDPCRCDGGKSGAGRRVATNLAAKRRASAPNTGLSSRERVKLGTRAAVIHEAESETKLQRSNCVGSPSAIRRANRKDSLASSGNNSMEPDRNILLVSRDAATGRHHLEDDEPNRRLRETTPVPALLPDRPRILRTCSAPQEDKDSVTEEDEEVMQALCSTLPASMTSRDESFYDALPAPEADKDRFNDMERLFEEYLRAEQGVVTPRVPVQQAEKKERQSRSRLANSRQRSQSASRIAPPMSLATSQRRSSSRHNLQNAGLSTPPVATNTSKDAPRRASAARPTSARSSTDKTQSASTPMRRGSASGKALLSGVGPTAAAGASSSIRPASATVSTGRGRASPGPAVTRGRASSPTPAATRGRAPSPAPATTRGRAASPAPAATRGQAPSPAPAVTRGRAPSPAPAATRGQAPNPAPAVTRGRAPSPAPAATRGRAPSPAPATRGRAPSPAPATRGRAPSPAPAASRGRAPSPAPVPTRGRAPSPSPHQSRGLENNPTPGGHGRRLPDTPSSPVGTATPHPALGAARTPTTHKDVTQQKNKAEKPPDRDLTQRQHRKSGAVTPAAASTNTTSAAKSARPQQQQAAAKRPQTPNLGRRQTLSAEVTSSTARPASASRARSVERPLGNASRLRPKSPPPFAKQAFSVATKSTPTKKAATARPQTPVQSRRAVTSPASTRAASRSKSLTRHDGRDGGMAIASTIEIQTDGAWSQATNGDVSSGSSPRRRPQSARAANGSKSPAATSVMTSPMRQWSEEEAWEVASNRSDDTRATPRRDHAGGRTRIPGPTDRARYKGDPPPTLHRFDSGVDINNVSPTGSSVHENEALWTEKETVALASQISNTYQNGGVEELENDDEYF